MATKRKRKISLGSGTIYHVKGARAVHKNAMRLFDQALGTIKRGECASALDQIAVANSDFGEFINEMRHGVGSYGRKGPAAAPRMRQAISNKRIQVQMAFAKACLLK